jgi:hypothetical protein
MSSWGELLVRARVQLHLLISQKKPRRASRQEMHHKKNVNVRCSIPPLPRKREHLGGVAKLQLLVRQEIAFDELVLIQK